MTNQQALNLLGIIEQIVERVEDKEDSRLPATLSYSFQKNLRQLYDAREDFQKVYQQLAKEYGKEPEEEGQVAKTDENGNVLFKDETSERKFKEEVAELSGNEADIDPYTVDLEYFKELELSVTEMSVLDPIIDAE